MNRTMKSLMLALKIGIGSSAALYIANRFGLEYAISAGTITLLTVMTSKWETLKLAVCRIATFTITVIIAWMLFVKISNIFIVYGLLLTIIVFIAEALGWRATISVNAVIAAHLVINHDFSDLAIWNEFQLVLIGIVFAVFCNLFHMNYSHKKIIITNMLQVENRLQMIIGSMGAYLLNKDMERNIWDDICQLEHDIQEYIKDAYEYQNNTFHSHPEYYISFFEMRYNQVQILHNLHYEMKKIRTMPQQARIIAEYMLYLTDYVREQNKPDEQIRRLKELTEHIKSEDLPTTREDFESRAMLYHIMMDLEEFLQYKLRFLKALNEQQQQIYMKGNFEKN